MQESWVRQCPVIDYQDGKVQYDQQDADHQEHIEGPMMPVTLSNRVYQVEDSIDGAWKEKYAKEIEMMVPNQLRRYSGPAAMKGSTF